MAKFGNAQNIDVVIDFPKEKTPSKFLPEEVVLKLANYGKFYTILHDKFSKAEEEETVHRHLVINAVEGKSSTTWIELLALIFEVPTNCISIESARNLKKCIRYLVHRDDEWKYQFPHDDVQTNDKRGWQSALQGGKVTATAVLGFKGTYLDFLSEFGVENTKRYWSMVENVNKERGILAKHQVERMLVLGLMEQWEAVDYDLKKAIKLAESGGKRWPRGTESGDLIQGIIDYLEHARKLMEEVKEKGVIEQ